ncbi:hypothetical protein BKA70DRAFT_181897 [Coprinopsis sp. MPI-PUGE-AT-0042]|nr:hypothetical protein BKA70DRAFT_181897 [Coprinopsis sp. MPI-PUGE-AT-0042]
MAATLSGDIPTPTILPPTASHNPFPKTFAPYIGAVFMETFLYGIYIVLFGICCFVLMRRHKALHMVLLIFAICMFALATADIIYTYDIFFNKLLVGTAKFKTLYPKYVMFVTNTVLADTLLLYRCFVVWGCKKRVVLGPAVLLFAATIVGYLFEGASMSLFQHSWVYLAMTFALNTILTALTAGRIWYLARTTKTIIDEGLLKRYNTTIAMLIESGLIYSIYMTFNLAFQSNTTANALLDAGLIQIVGIVPTLMVVQVGLGRSINGDVNNDETAAQRIETNRASMANSRYSGGAGMGNYDGPGSYIASIRSARSTSSRYSNARPISHELGEHRRSFRSVMSGKPSSQRAPSYIDTSSMNASRRTLYDLRTSDTYTLPNSPSSASQLRSPSLRSPPPTSLSLRSPSLRTPTTPSQRSPSSPKSLVHFPGSPTFPPSPVLEKSEIAKAEGGFQPFSDFGEAITRIETIDSDDSETRGYFTAV